VKYVICPACRLRVGLEHKGGGLKLTYDIQAWQRDCHDPHSGAGLCLHLRPILAAALANGGIEEPPKDTGDATN
jgi:hypothetical protein